MRQNHKCEQLIIAFYGLQFLNL